MRKEEGKSRGYIFLLSYQSRKKTNIFIDKWQWSINLFGENLICIKRKGYCDNYSLCVSIKVHGAIMSLVPTLVMFPNYFEKN